MSAAGHLIGYGAGTIDLVKVFGTTLGDTQFKKMTVIAAAGLLVAQGVTAYAVHERVLISARYARILSIAGEVLMRFGMQRRWKGRSLEGPGTDL
jgi:hypothetical protein